MSKIKLVYFASSFKGDDSKSDEAIKLCKELTTQCQETMNYLFISPFLLFRNSNDDEVTEYKKQILKHLVEQVKQGNKDSGAVQRWSLIWNNDVSNEMEGMIADMYLLSICDLYCRCDDIEGYDTSLGVFGELVYAQRWNIPTYKVLRREDSSGVFDLKLLHFDPKTISTTIVESDDALHQSD